MAPPEWGSLCNLIMLVFTILFVGSQFRFRWKFPEAYAILAHTCVTSQGEGLMKFKPLRLGAPLDPVASARFTLPAAGESSDLRLTNECCWWAQ